MSSARSITAARARRAGETPVAQNPIINRGNNNVVNKGRTAPQQLQQQPQKQIQRPIQQQQQPQQQSFTYNQSVNQNMGSRQPQVPLQQKYQSQQQDYDQNDQIYDGVQQPQQFTIPNPKGKITIGDAIGLITIRLGRVEQYIQQLQEDGELQDGDEGFVQGQSSNITGLDPSVFKNIIDRLDRLETKQNSQAQQQPQQPHNTQSKDLVDKVLVDKLEKELKETKDLLMMMVLKHEKHTGDTTIRFDTVEDKVNNFESKIEYLENDIDYLKKQNDNLYTEPVYDNISINDLKASSMTTEFSKGNQGEYQYEDQNENQGEYQGEDISSFSEYSNSNSVTDTQEETLRQIQEQTQYQTQYQTKEQFVKPSSMFIPVDNNMEVESNDSLQGLDLSSSNAYLQESEFSNTLGQQSTQYKSNSFTYDPNVV